MNDDFRLVDSGWNSVIEDALCIGGGCLQVICPFIKKSVVERLLKNGNLKNIQVITRFNLADFCEGVSDTAALRLLLGKGAKIRGVRNLHAKLYLFGNSRAIVTSANLSEAALSRNHEFGVVADDTAMVGCCADYFTKLWQRAGQDLTRKRLDDWEKKLEAHLASGARVSRQVNLGDEGVDAGDTSEPIITPTRIDEAPQAFVKFFGISSDRADRSLSVLLEVNRAGCHWACTYPEKKRPRKVEDGAIMYMARLVENPKDIIIFGRAVAMKHEPGRDEATVADIKKRSFKAQWPNYIRVHHAEFVAGTMGNGVSLNKLMDALKSNAFAATQRNAASNALNPTAEQQNTDPRKAYMQQAHVELSPEGFDWLNSELEEAFAKHGQLATTELEQLDWPELPK